MSRIVKTVVFWTVIFISALLLWQIVRRTPQDRATPEISYSRFMSEVDAGNVASVVISGTQIRGAFRAGEGFRLTGPSSAGVYIDQLRSKGVGIRFEDTQDEPLPLRLLSTWAPLILLGALWFSMIRRMQHRRPPASGQGPPGGTDMSRPIEPR